MTAQTLSPYAKHRIGTQCVVRHKTVVSVLSRPNITAPRPVGRCRSVAVLIDFDNMVCVEQQSDVYSVVVTKLRQAIHQRHGVVILAHLHLPVVRQIARRQITLLHHKHPVPYRVGIETLDLHRHTISRYRNMAIYARNVPSVVCRSVII